MLTVQTRSGTITVDNEFFTITRTRMQAFGTDAARGERRIPIDMISAVQLRPPGLATAGFLQLRLAGGMETKGGTWNSLKDENAVQFDKRQQKQIEQVRDFVESRIRQRMQRPAHAYAPPTAAPQAVRIDLPPPTPQADPIATLREYAKLRDEGILTEEEFAAQKAKVLGSSS